EPLMTMVSFLFLSYGLIPDLLLLSFPTRRSSDLSASYISIKTQMSNRSKVIKTQRTIDSVNQILIDLQNVETGQRGYLLTGEVRSEEHTSELQSRENLVCRLLLEKKN